MSLNDWKLKRIRMSTDGKRHYRLRSFHVWWPIMVNYGPLTKMSNSHFDFWPSQNQLRWYGVSECY